AVTLTAEQAAELSVTVSIENLHAYETREAEVTITIHDEAGQTVVQTEEASLRSGINYARLLVTIPNERKWWPNGMGEPHQYTIAVTVQSGPIQLDYPAFRYGVRSLRLNTSKLDEGGRRFTFEINGLPVFCKGANWIPADSIYARVTDERYDT